MSQQNLGLVKHPASGVCPCKLNKFFPREPEAKKRRGAVLKGAPEGKLKGNEPLFTTAPWTVLARLPVSVTCQEGLSAEGSLPLQARTVEVSGTRPRTGMHGNAEQRCHTGANTRSRRWGTGGGEMPAGHRECGGSG